MLRVAAALAALLGAGCSTIDTYVPTLRSFGVYKLDVNQGNFLSQDMVDKLKVGQTKQQVRLILGTPLIASAFRDDRWDYDYEFTRQGRVVEHRKFTVYFVDEQARALGRRRDAAVGRPSSIARPRRQRGKVDQRRGGIDLRFRRRAPRRSRRLGGSARRAASGTL